MEYKQTEIKKGIKIHTIKTEKFKTNLIAIMLTTKLDRENVTKNALIPAVLRRGTKNLTTQEEINKKLEEMYGAGLDCGLDKTGDNQVLKFYIETVNDEFLPQEAENMLKISLEKIFEFVFNPYLENGCFKKEYVEQEKENIKQIIDGKIDNKARYSLDRCIEEMYKDQPYGLYKYGYVEDMKDINEKNLYETYLDLISKCKIDIFLSGDLEEQNTIELIKNNENIKKLQPREDIHIINSEENQIKQEVEVKTIQESKDVTQGKLVIGLDVNCNKPDSRYSTCIYNVILGESATSKMFQNVREKAGLAYSARSTYLRQKNNIFIRAGIEIENYEKALKIIEEQLDDMKKGKFTDEDIQNAKKYMISGIKTVQDEQDSEITYYLGQEISGKQVSFEEYMDKINWISRDEIENIANSIKINTIYFLRN